MKEKQTVKQVLSSKRNLVAIQHLIEELRVLYKVAYMMNRSERKKYEKGLREVGKLLKCKSTEVGFTSHSFGDEAARDFFIKRLMEKGIAKQLWPKYTIFNGKKITTSWRLMDSIFKVKDEFVTVHPYSVRINVHNVEFLLIPNVAETYDRQHGQAGFCFAIYKKDNAGLVAEAMEKLRDDHDPLKGQVVTFGNTLAITDLKSKFTLDQVVMSPGLKEEIELLENMFKNYKSLVTQKVPFKRGILLSGAPGCGKTTVVSALANRITAAGGTVFIIASQDLQQHSLYRYVKRFAPVMIVYEDFDLIAQRRNQFNNTVKSDLLNVLEGSLGVDGVVTIGTTNLIETLDEAAIRHGRIDKIYSVPLPTKEMKEEILKLHMDYYKIKAELPDAIEALKDFLIKPITGAAISSIVLGARQKAAVDNREASLEDLRWSVNNERRTQEALGFKQ